MLTVTILAVIDDGLHVDPRCVTHGSTTRVIDPATAGEPYDLGTGGHFRFPVVDVTASTGERVATRFQPVMGPEHAEVCFFTPEGNAIRPDGSRLFPTT